MRIEVQEIDPDDWSGCGNTLPRPQFRRVVVEDGHTPEVRQHLRELRARGVNVGHVLGDELNLRPGDTKRGAPPGFTHPSLCGARTKGGHPCRAMKVAGRKRCRWHGGLSTGPRTPDGKAKCARNLPWARKPRW